MQAPDIHFAIRVLKNEIKQWPEPVLGVIAKEKADPFHVLIACILSLRTKDQTTKEASHRLFSLAKGPNAMARLPVNQLERAIYPVGFYRTKAKHIHGICERLLTSHRGLVPDTIQELLMLEGVGRKTANLVVTLGFKKPGICVDVHVHRISNRWGYVKTSKPEETEHALRKKLPRQYWRIFNDLLVPFGQHCCRPVSPFCSQCPVISFCRRIGVSRSR